VISFFWDVSIKLCNNKYLNIGDGIFDRLDNEEIFNKIWSYKKKGEVHEDIRTLCGKITDGIIKYSMQKNSGDNVSVIFIAFKNFENKMKDPNFEYTAFPKVVNIKEKYDFSMSSK
jgi:serine/threonine protein phosphatase PrpC